MTIAPSLVIFSAAIPHTLVATGALMAGPITAAQMMSKSKSKSKNSLLPYGSALYTGLWGMIGVGIMSIISPALGFHQVGLLLHNIDLYGGVMLFTVYNAYDTHVIINAFENGKKDHIGHAVNYSLNAINIYYSIIILLLFDH
jgi:FtsH-binding integral membrane protein